MNIYTNDLLHDTDADATTIIDDDGDASGPYTIVITSSIFNRI